jgi:adenylate cyclase
MVAPQAAYEDVLGDRHRANGMSTQDAWIRRHLPAGIVALAGIMISLSAFFYVDRLETARLAAELRGMAAQPVSAIERQIQADFGSVTALVAFYNGSRYVERGEFRAFAAPILDWHPSIQALEWLPRVTAGEREAYEARARQDGHLQFQITERSPQGEMVAAGARAEYFPVYYVEPRAGNQLALGFDVGSDAARLAALMGAGEAGRMRATATLTLVQETESQRGFLVVAPVYKGGSSRPPTARRTESPMGFVVAVFRIGDLVAHALARDQRLGHSAATDFALSIYEGVEPGGRRLVFASRGTDARADQAEPSSGVHVSRLIDVAGRSWQIIVTPRGGRRNERFLWLPWAVLMVGLGFTACAAPVYHFRRLGNARLNQLARSLDEKNQMLEAVSAKLSAYLPAQVYQSIFTGQRDASIATERKKLTVFFSDIEDFTAVTGDLEPEDLTFLLNDYFSEMSTIARQYGATIDKFIGDAMLMFFGDPDSRGVKEDAVACLHMAVAMQRRLVDLRMKWRDMGHRRSFHARMGINTGYCNVGNFGSRERMNYTIVGGEVNKAARMQSLAESDGIAMTAETLALVRDQFAAREGELTRVKGLPGEMRPYLVDGVHDQAAGERVIRSESEAVRVFVDLTKLDEKMRGDAARQLDEIALRLRQTDASPTSGRGGRA